MVSKLAEDPHAWAVFELSAVQIILFGKTKNGDIVVMYSLGRCKRDMHTSAYADGRSRCRSPWAPRHSNTEHDTVCPTTPPCQSRRLRDIRLLLWHPGLRGSERIRQTESFILEWRTTGTNVR